MLTLWRAAKRVVFWSYGRTTWQYDVLCALILAFIFLTPKTWFERSELVCRQAHQRDLSTAGKLLIRPENASARPDAHEIERCARKVTGRSEVRVRAWREVPGADGTPVAYEVDIE